MLLCLRHTFCTTPAASHPSSCVLLPSPYDPCLCPNHRESQPISPPLKRYEMRPVMLFMPAAQSPNPHNDPSCLWRPPFKKNKSRPSRRISSQQPALGPHDDALLPLRDRSQPYVPLADRPQRSPTCVQRKGRAAPSYSFAGDATQSRHSARTPWPIPARMESGLFAPRVSKRSASRAVE